MESEECESDDPVEFLERDDCSGVAYTELYFQSVGFCHFLNCVSPRQQHDPQLSEESESEEERKKSFSKFSHDLRKDPKHRQKVPQFDTSTSVSFISKVVLRILMGSLIYFRLDPLMKPNPSTILLRSSLAPLPHPSFEEPSSLPHWANPLAGERMSSIDQSTGTAQQLLQFERSDHCHPKNRPG
jgi:hypothetical protein